MSDEQELEQPAKMCSRCGIDPPVAHRGATFCEQCGRDAYIRDTRIAARLDGDDGRPKRTARAK